MLSLGGVVHVSVQRVLILILHKQGGTHLKRYTLNASLSSNEPGPQHEAEYEKASCENLCRR